jgi:phosphoglycolate phosphatase-like HAD superfamily hydrolase
MIIFDLDGTLADCEHRRPLIAGRARGEKARWDEFFARCGEDAPIEPVIAVLLALRPQARVQIWSGRSEVVRELTERWLTEHVFGNWAWTVRAAPTMTNDHRVPLRMRPAGDTTPDDALKEGWLRAHRAAGGERVTMVFDDRQKVVDMWRRNGIVCAQVARGDF